MLKRSIDKFNYSKDDKLEVFTPQCKSCKFYIFPDDCEKGIKLDMGILKNEIKCKEYAKLKKSY